MLFPLLHFVLQFKRFLTFCFLKITCIFIYNIFIFINALYINAFFKMHIAQ